MARYEIMVNDLLVEFPSTTEIIDACFDKSDGLIGWATGEMYKWVKQNTSPEMDYESIMNAVSVGRFKFREVSETAKDNGTAVHDLIEDYIKFGINKTTGRDYNDQIKNAFEAFLQWEKDNQIKWIESELKVYDTEIYVAGKMDALCYYNDEVYVIDFKSSKGFYDGFDLQIASYTYLYNSMEASTVKVNHCGILRLDKETGLPEFKDYSKNLDRKYEAFLKLVDFYYLYKNRRLKNNPRTNIDKLEKV
jgi:hypothetical protein